MPEGSPAVCISLFAFSFPAQCVRETEVKSRSATRREAWSESLRRMGCVRCAAAGTSALSAPWRPPSPLVFVGHRRCLWGMAAGITMGEQLAGVDPFNITTFR